ncbi:META domain-containing protein [Candidatus Leptofilum sp.]|uniref:META domain-containing protein n=1 Tax=Candidatus Leptofilum sp. TaxID=3241576 RepID=UPI003B5B84BB
MNNKVRGLHISYWAGVICVIFLTACAGANRDNVAQLEGKTWTLTAYDNSQPIAGHQPTILFEDGEISGSTGCNHYGGTYQSENDTIQFEQIFSTEMACLEPVELMEQERLYLEALTMVSRYELENEILTFFSDSNSLLTFEIKGG